MTSDKRAEILGAIEDKTVKKFAEWARTNTAGYGEDEADIWFEDLPNYDTLEWTVRILTREALTQHHQSLMSEVAEKIEKAKKEADKFVPFQRIHHKEGLTEAQDIINSLTNTTL